MEKSLFISQDEMQQLTGCKTMQAQELALRAHKIKYLNNGRGLVVIRSQFDSVPASKRPVNAIPSEKEILKLEAMPRNGIGIYFLCQGKEIMYVGKTTNFFLRMSNHLASTYEFDAVRFLPCSEKKLDALEREYIARFKPRFNKLHNKKDAEDQP